MAINVIFSDGSSSKINYSLIDSYTIKISFSVEKVGTYSITGKYLQKLLVNVQSGQPDPIFSSCKIQGSTNVNLYDQVIYGCTAKDKYGNNVNVNEAASIYKSNFTCSITNKYMNNTTTINVPTAGNDPNGLGYL